MFPADCTETDPRIDGDLIVDTWQLVNLPIYACCLVLLAVALVCHTTNYLILEFIRRPHTA